MSSASPFQRERLVLIGILVLAAVLRFTALGAGLRHRPHLDEQYFVENVRGMLVRGDLQPRFYEYPGLVFYLLWPVLAFADRATLAPDGYLLARGVVAAFGVASVFLVCRLGRRLSGPVAGLAAALLLAVSPVEVHTAHTVRPDVILESFVLLALIAFDRVGPRGREDVLSGAALGAAVAVKFSGVLLAASYLVRRLAVPGARLRGLVLAALVSLLVFAVLSPFTLLDVSSSLAGVQTQVGYHYVERARGPQAFLDMASTYARILWKAIGPVAVVLALAGLALSRREWRRWLPLATLVLLTVVVFSTAEVQHDRFLVPVLGVVALFAGHALQALSGRQRAAALLLALVAAALPAAASITYLRGISRPSTLDRALDWIDAHATDGARILTTLPELGLDRRRYEVLATEGFDRRAERLAPEVALVVARAEEAAREPLVRAASLEPASPHEGPPLVVASAAEGARPVYRALSLQPAQLSASESADQLAAAVDGDLQTAWETGSRDTPGAWIQVDLPRPTRLGRVDLLLGPRPRRYAGNLLLFVRAPGADWARVPVVPGRPPVDEQLEPKGGAASQVLLFEPVAVTGVRLVDMARRVRPWSVAELKLFETPAMGPEPR